MRVIRFLIGGLIMAVVVVGWLVLQPGKGDSQPSAPGGRWDDRIVTALTPDSIIARHVTFDTLPDGISRIDRIVPFLNSHDYDAMGNDFMGCPCCPAPRMTTWMNISGDTLPPIPPCCIPCMPMMESQMITRRSPVALQNENAPYISTRQLIPAGILSVYGAVQIGGTEMATDPLPVTFDILIKGVDAVPLPIDAGALSVQVPPGPGRNGHLRAVRFRRDFRVTGGSAEIALMSKMTGEHPDAQIADGVLGIMYLPDMRPPETE